MNILTYVHLLEGKRLASFLAQILFYTVSIHEYRLHFCNTEDRRFHSTVKLNTYSISKVHSRCPWWGYPNNFTAITQVHGRCPWWGYSNNFTGPLCKLSSSFKLLTVPKNILVATMETESSLQYPRKELVFIIDPAKYQKLQSYMSTKIIMGVNSDVNHACNWTRV